MQVPSASSLTIRQVSNGWVITPSQSGDYYPTASDTYVFTGPLPLAEFVEQWATARENAAIRTEAAGNLRPWCIPPGKVDPPCCSATFVSEKHCRES